MDVCMEAPRKLEHVREAVCLCVKSIPRHVTSLARSKKFRTYPCRETFMARRRAIIVIVILPASGRSDDRQGISCNGTSIMTSLLILSDPLFVSGALLYSVDREAYPIGRGNIPRGEVPK